MVGWPPPALIGVEGAYQRQGQLGGGAVGVWPAGPAPGRTPG